MKSSTLTCGAFLVAFLPCANADGSCSWIVPPEPPTGSSSLTDDPSYTPATAVFLLRDGTKTILTIEPAYEGPTEELTMVIPVPEAIERAAVRTVTGSLFRGLDRATAPRVEHGWYCRHYHPPGSRMSYGIGGGGGGGRLRAARTPTVEYFVSVEDEWEVEEYDITLLSAEQSGGLLAFLRDRGLALPDRAESVLRGYIESGHRFVLARVDPTRARTIGERMMLSPLQLEYDSEELVVPVRLGTLNSPGEQELLLYVLSRDGRYELANRENVIAPSDIRLSNEASGQFAAMYRGLLTELYRQHPGAAVTEYARLLGHHVRLSHVWRFGLDRLHRRGGRGDGRWTLTRIRHRYGVDLDDDLVLRPGAPIRLTRRWPYAYFDTNTRQTANGFHVRYIVEHSARCPSLGVRRRYTRRWATAESMWTTEEEVWPGALVLEPITSLSIEPGSSPPPPPPPPQPPEPPAPAEPSAVAHAAPAAEPPNPSEAVASSGSSPEASSDSLCAASPGPGSRLPLLAVVLALGLAATRRPR